MVYTLINTVFLKAKGHSHLMEFEIPLTVWVRISTSLICTLNARCPPARSQKVGPCTLPPVDPESRLHIWSSNHQSHDYPEWVLLRKRREGLSVVDALFQSEPQGDKPGLVSLNLAFGVPLGLLNLHPKGLAPSGNSNQPNQILVLIVHILPSYHLEESFPPMACENVTGSSTSVPSSCRYTT